MKNKNNKDYEIVKIDYENLYKQSEEMITKDGHYLKFSMIMGDKLDSPMSHLSVLEASEYDMVCLMGCLSETLEDLKKKYPKLWEEAQTFDIEVTSNNKDVE